MGSVDSYLWLCGWLVPDAVGTERLSFDWNWTAGCRYTVAYCTYAHKPIAWHGGVCVVPSLGPF
eukprot:scaffold95406_cov59-Attheya_sp.AAC.5